MCLFADTYDQDKVDRFFVDVFLDAYAKPPRKIILDLDATDDPLHGHQEGRFFHVTTAATAICRCTSSAATSCSGKPRALYEKLYCARGDMENRIKEQQLAMFADRTSTHTMRANQMRLYFASVADILVSAFRRVALRNRAGPRTVRTTVIPWIATGSFRMRLWRRRL